MLSGLSLTILRNSDRPAPAPLGNVEGAFKAGQGYQGENEAQVRPCKAGGGSKASV